MKIVCISDLHGYLPSIPDCDLLLIAGDICPYQNHRLVYQQKWLDFTFRRWLYDVPAKQVIGIAGNHDLIFERRPDWVPDLPWTYLQDSGCYVRGLYVYGLPWQKRFHDWAFNLDEPELDEKYKSIPQCDIILSHGPAFGYGDCAQRETEAGHEHVGNIVFTQVIERIKPKLVVTGHIHEDPGRWVRPCGTTIINATIMDARYRPINKPFVYEITPN